MIEINRGLEKKLGFEAIFGLVKSCKKNITVKKRKKG